MPHQGNELSGDAAQPILDLQHRWVAALVKADTGALDTILVDSYADTDESGSRFDKAGVLAALKSGDLKLASITLLETNVHRYGDSAVLIGASAQTGVFRGSTHRTEDTVHRRAGFAKRQVESGSGTPNRRAPV
jgi:hypothetical protein